MPAVDASATAPISPDTAGETPETDSELAARLRLSVMRLGRLLRNQVGDDVTASQISALSSLARRGTLTVGELSVVERVKPPTMTRVVASLEELGLVTRTADDLDRRVAHVAATPEGLALLTRSRQRKDAFLASRLATLAEADRDGLRRAADLMERLVDGA